MEENKYIIISSQSVSFHFSIRFMDDVSNSLPLRKQFSVTICKFNLLQNIIFLKKAEYESFQKQLDSISMYKIDRRLYNIKHLRIYKKRNNKLYLSNTLHTKYFQFDLKTCGVSETHVQVYFGNFKAFNSNRTFYISFKYSLILSNNSFSIFCNLQNNF